MASYDEGYWRGYKDGAQDKKNKLVTLVQSFHFNNEWQAHEIKRALLKLLEAERST